MILPGFAQLDTIHWLPPLNSADPTQVADHYVYISTPTLTTFTVTITDGSGTVLATVPVSNTIPYRYYIGNGQPTHFMVTISELNTPLPNRGLILHGKFPFYANLRVQSADQAEHITANGRAAEGTLFRAGVVPMRMGSSNRNFVLGMIATQDCTHVKIKGYDKNISFAGSPYISQDSTLIKLKKGDCYVVSGYTNTSDPAANLAGFTGATIESDNPIVINNGNFLGSVENQNLSQDIMVKQTIPLNWLGTDYIVIRGNGTDSMEAALVIAAYDSTIVSVNCKVIDTIMKTDGLLTNAGKYKLIFNSYSPAPGLNMYIHTSKPAYVYETLGADSNSANTGLDLIPPLNCGLPREINQMDSINYIGKTEYTTDLFAFTATPPTTLSINGIQQTAGSPIACLPGWVTYRVTGLKGNVKIVSTGPMAAGVFGYNGDASFAGYFSGFGVTSTINIATNNTMICGDTTKALLNLSSLGGVYDSLKWYRNDTLVSTGGGVNDSVYTTKGGTFKLEALNGSCSSISNIIIIKDCLPPPITIPNVFTPNGDGKNDVFRIDSLSHYPGSKLEIYNRWGNLIYESSDYQNNWNGVSQQSNKKCSDGVYFYILNLGTKKNSYKGFVQLLGNGA